MNENEKFYESSNFWSGVGLYYLFVWIFAFYPAFIITFGLRRLFFGMSEEGDSCVFAIVCMIILTFVIVGLAKMKQYFIVLMLYLLTLWPFLYILGHLWNCKSGAEYPLPLDWWPLW